MFTACKPNRSLISPLPVGCFESAASLEEVHARQLVDIEKLQQALSDMHRHVGARISSARQKAVEQHNAQTNVQSPSLQVEDSVLVRSAQQKGRKLNFLWGGPRRMRGTHSELVYEVEDLVSRTVESVHAQRLLSYRADMDGTPVDDPLLRYAQHSEAQYQDAGCLVVIRERESAVEIQIEWRGHLDEIDLTWEPLQQVAEDLPALIAEFLPKPRSTKPKRQAVALCSSE